MTAGPTTRLQTRIARDGQRMFCGRLKCTGQVGVLHEGRWRWFYRGKCDEHGIYRVRWSGHRQYLKAGTYTGNLGAAILHGTRVACPSCGIVNVAVLPDSVEVKA